MQRKMVIDYANIFNILKIKTTVLGLDENSRESLISENLPINLALIW